MLPARVTSLVAACTPNPLEDIRNTARIRAVVLDGRYLNRTALDKLLEDAAQASHPKQK